MDTTARHRPATIGNSACRSCGDPLMPPRSPRPPACEQRAPAQPVTALAGADRRPSRWPMRMACRLAGCALMAVRLSSPAAGVEILTQHSDNARSGANTAETILRPENVNAASFGLLYSVDLDGQISGQVLYVPGLMINGAVRKVAFFSTGACSVYACDAEASGAVLW